jgi:hypothetical protein
MKEFYPAPRVWVSYPEKGWVNCIGLPSALRVGVISPEVTLDNDYTRSISSGDAESSRLFLCPVFPQATFLYLNLG